MILVRNRNGTLYFLASEGDETLDSLGRSYPGRTAVVVKKGDGLVLLRIDSLPPAEDGEAGDRLAIVNLVLPPAPPAFSFRGQGSVTPLR